MFYTSYFNFGHKPIHDFNSVLSVKQKFHIFQVKWICSIKCKVNSLPLNEENFYNSLFTYTSYWANGQFVQEF